jgi:DNA polymerase III epsilon subunit-like protein
MSSILWIDTETTALGDKAAIIELALVPVINGEQKEPFVTYIRPHPEAFIDPEAMRINGIDPKLFPTFPTAEEVVKQVIEYVDQFETVFSLGGQNVKFDINHFFRLFCRTANYSSYVVRFDANSIDTLSMAKEVFKNKKIKPKSNKLGDICSFFDIQLANAHTALCDILATIQVYDKLSSMMPKLIPTVNNMTYHQKRQKYMAADYLTINPEGDVYINCKVPKDQDAAMFVLNELWRLWIK